MKRLLLLSAVLFCWLAAPAAGAQKPTGKAASSPPAAPAVASADRQAEAYYDFVMGHVNEERYDATGDFGYAAKAVEFYKKALELEPESPVIGERLAETYAKSQQIRDAVFEAKRVLARDPASLDAHRLLGRIYVRSLGDLSASGQKETLDLAIEQYQKILELSPKDDEAAVWLARLYGFENEHGKAAEVLRGLLDREPGNEEALAQYSRLMLDSGRADEAVARLKKGLGPSSDAQLYGLLGDAYAQEKKLAEAEQAYRQAAALDAGEPAYRQGLARTLLSEEKYDEALSEYQQLTAMDPKDPENYLRLAQIDLQKKKLDLAEANASRAQSLAPDNLEVLYTAALVAQAQARFDDAARLLSGAVDQVAKDPDARRRETRLLGVLYDTLGRVYRQQEKYPAALDAFQKMSALGPVQAKQARLEIIATYQTSGQIDPAIAVARQAMEQDPHDLNLKITYALLLGEKEQTDDAAKMLEGLLTGSPEDLQIYVTLAQVYERGRRFPEAEQAARHAESLAKRPEDHSLVWLLLGAIYQREKQYDRAEQEFRKALAVNPRDATVLNDFGYMLAERGVRLDEAVSLVERALNEDGDNAAYLDSLGWAYYKGNRLTDAERYLLKAVARGGHDPTILTHLGEVYYKMGRTADAIAAWEKALEAWHHVLPADYEPDKVAGLEKRLASAKAQVARKEHGAAPQPR
jgi:tetratricopeptide (TPR) repeat protein